MRIRIVLGVALVLVGVAVVVALSQHGRRLAGTSFVAQSSFTVAIPPHAEACQQGTRVVDDSAATQLLVGTYGKPVPRLRVTFATANGTVLARGAAAGGGGQGPVLVPFARAVEGDHVATACVRNAGTWPISLGGRPASAAAAAQAEGRAAGGIIGFRYLRAGRETWWSLLPEVAQRFGVGKATLFGTWTLPVAILLLAALWTASIRLLLKEAP